MQLSVADRLGLPIQLGVPNSQGRQLGCASSRVGRHTPSGKDITGEPILEVDAFLEVLSQPWFGRPPRCDLAGILLLWVSGEEVQACGAEAVMRA